MLVWAKAPPAETLRPVSVASPLLVSVTVLKALAWPTVWTPKFSARVEKLSFAPVGPDVGVPTPKRRTCCGLFAEPSLMLSDASRCPVVAGVKVTATVQLAPPVSELPQPLFEIAKSPALGPVIRKLRVAALIALLVRVVVWPAL